MYLPKAEEMEIWNGPALLPSHAIKKYSRCRDVRRGVYIALATYGGDAMKAGTYRDAYPWGRFEIVSYTQLGKGVAIAPIYMYFTTYIPAFVQ